MRNCMCDVSVVVSVHAELDKSSVDNVERAEDVIVSQWRDVSVDERRQMRAQVDEVLRPLGYETSLLVIRRANSIALFFICMTLSAVESLRKQWHTKQLRSIIQSLFVFLSYKPSLWSSIREVHVKRLSWPQTDYERYLEFFRSVRGKQTTCSSII